MLLFNKPARLTGIALPILFLLLTFRPASAQNRRAMDFPGTTAFEHVNLGDSLSASLDTISFTMEMWLRLDNTGNGDPAFIGNKDWNLGTNTGFAWVMTNSSTLRFNFRPASGTRRDYNTSVANLSGWNHIAATVNRSGNLVLYVNGVQTGTPINISADAGKKLDGLLPIRLGTDGTGTYNYGGISRFNGKIDELRFWKSVRSASEIQAAMCRKLNGNEIDLLAYYPMDDTSTSVLRNEAVATSGIYDGAFVNTPVRILSGAPVGDTSVALYTTSFTGQSLQLPTTSRGVFAVDSFSGSGTFVQLYRMDSVPQLTGGLTPYKTNDVAYGVFTTNAGLNYYPKISYANFDSAVAYKKTIQFFRRAYNDDSTWTSVNSLYNDTAANTLRSSAQNGPRQLFLANFVGTCNTPAVLSATTSFNSAGLSWTTGGSGAWNIEYGAAGFTPGSGTRVRNINANPYNVTGLQPTTAYEFYVQDSCTGLGVSTWAGPFRFTTQALPTWHINGPGAAIDISNSGWIDATGKAGRKIAADSIGMPVQNMTVEAWLNIRQFEDWRAAVGFIQDNGTFERGWDLETGNGNKFRFGLSAENDTFMYYMPSANSFRNNEWYHVAGTYDGDTMRLYVNGMLEAKNGAPQGKIKYADSWLAIGQYKDDNEAFSLRGVIDEVRLWNVTRSEQELREAMCHKLKGNEAGLIRYYRFDQYAGDTLTEHVAGLSGKLNGIPAANWKVSGAAIGDTSVQAYAMNASTINLNLGGAQGSLGIDSIAANAKGAHIYRIDTAPHFTTGIADPGAARSYFGVFLAENAPLSYRVDYDYSGYAAAVVIPSNLRLYNRNHNAVQRWVQSPVANNQTARRFTQKSAWGTRQWLLSDFATPTCAGASNLAVSGITATGATLGWSSSAALHRVLYGNAGSALDSGIYSSYAGASSYAMTGLRMGATYEAYVMDSCANGSEVLTGPVFFTTVNPCMTPLNGLADSIRDVSAVLKWTDAGAAPGFNISWGPAGFGSPSFGIQVNAAGNRHLLSGLQPLTSYDFYVRSNCGSFSSAWAGPYNFRTDSVGFNVGLPQLNGSSLVSVFPNPADQQIQLRIRDGNTAPAQVQLINALGQQLYSAAVIGSDIRIIPTGGFAPGMYQLHISRDGRALHNQSVIIRH